MTSTRCPIPLNLWSRRKASRSYDDLCIHHICVLFLSRFRNYWHSMGVNLFQFNLLYSFVCI